MVDPSGNRSQVVLRPVRVMYPPDCTNSFLAKEDLTLSEQVMVYPNPTTGLVTFDFALNNSSPVHVEITNMVGSKVAEYNFSGGFGSQEIDLGKFGQGTYLINIRNNNEVTTKKIIVTN